MRGADIEIRSRRKTPCYRMSKNARFIPMIYPGDRSALADLDWAEWETKSGAKFPDESRREIEDAIVEFRSMERAINSGLLIKFEHMRKTLRTLKKWISELGERCFFEDYFPYLTNNAGFGSKPCDTIAKAIDYVSNHVASEQGEETNLENQIGEMLRLMKDFPEDVSMDLPRTEACAVYSIKLAFQKMNLPAKVRHTFPTAVPEGSETPSVFEDFCFTFVLTDIGRSQEERKTLYRRLKEGERAILKSKIMRD